MVLLGAVVRRETLAADHPALTVRVLVLRTLLAAIVAARIGPLRSPERLGRQDRPGLFARGGHGRHCRLVLVELVIRAAHRVVYDDLP